MPNESLPRSDDAFRLLVEGARDYAIFMLDLDGRVVTWNPGAEKIKGYRADEIIGRHFSCFYPAEQIARGWPEQELRTARREGRVEDEGWRLRKDGTRFWANVVITALYHQDGQLRGFGKLTRDLTERKQFEALEARERELNEFLAMLSHELRNPLAPMRNALSVLKTGSSDETLVRWSHNVIDRQLEHMTLLVNDLLDVSRMTSGKIMLREQSLDLREVIEHAVEASRPLIEERRHVLKLLLPTQPLAVRGDATRLSQVLQNLLTNAAKYTPDSGSIEVSAARDGDDAMVHVRDTGVGIPAELLKRVFDLFAQGTRSLDRSEGGLGIGLTLAERLVQQHGGAIRAHSDGLGCGSEFTVRLPILDAEVAPQQSPTSQPEPTPSVATHRVLIVDDHCDSAASLCLLVRRLGHEAWSTYDGPSALARAAEQKPDIVLLDIGLPEMDGFEVARRLRSIPGLERIVIVALTGYGRSEDRRATEQAGFDLHWVKPVDSRTLTSLLNDPLR